jgi:hypothetical protein
VGRDGSGTIVADIFHEVDEEVRREQLKKLWDRYSIYLIALAVLIVAGMAAWRGYEYWVAKQAAAAGAEFEAAIALNEEGKRAEAEAAFAKVAAQAPAGYRVLARMRAAGVSITTALSPEFQQTLRAAGQVAVDDWVQRMGPAATPILDAYRQRLGR